MKNILTRLCVILFYIYLLLYAFHFRFLLLWDAKSLFLVCTGTLLLSFAGWRRTMKRRQFIESCAACSMQAACMTAFVELFVRLSTPPPSLEQVVPTLALCCRPLLYGYLIHLVLLPEARAAQTPAQNVLEESAGTNCSPNIPPLSVQTLEQALRQAGLTPRETEITLLVREGLTNKEIAERLFISDTTVKKHISNIFEKLQLTNREQLKHIF